MIGKTLGHYRVVEKIGAGGMGEVYRARDERLGREVAIKVLPEAFAGDPERLARFGQEARLLAALNHPHIAAIYGLEESNGVRFLVLELVDGETLAERLGRGALPVDEALTLCRQMAEALEAAHERGIIHRDLKPGNVKVTPEGKVKVLDFGLAKAFGPEAAATDLSRSPTASYGSSREGAILGTAAYMSPEQARGKPLDKRTDIWSFGCVLYEALSGRQAFSGETLSDTIAKILEREPDWQALPAQIAPSIQILLRRCLQKDPNRRVRDIGDARIEIEEALTAPAALGPAVPAIAPAPTWRRMLPWALVGLLATATGILSWQLARVASRPRAVARLIIPLAPTEPLELETLRPALALSPDGTRLVYVANRAGIRQLYLRALDQAEDIPIPGTEGAYNPFFSPDGQWVGFFVLWNLKKVSLAGGPPVTLAIVPPVTRGASWGPDGTVFFTKNPNGPLSSVSAGGGRPAWGSSGIWDATKVDGTKGEFSHRWPEVLPGGKAVLFTVDTGGSFDDARVAVLDLKTGKIKTLIEGGTNARYARSGHLIFARAGALLAAPFDLGRLEVTGEPVKVVDAVLMESEGAAHFALSEGGTLAYVAGGSWQPNRKLVWVNRQGESEPLPAPPRAYMTPSLSPDGRQVALTIPEGSNYEIWLSDVARGTLTRLTFDPNEDFNPIWTPDGKRVTFSSEIGGTPPQLFSAPADGSGGPEKMIDSQEGGLVEDPGSYSPDGHLLAFVHHKWEVDIGSWTQSDLWVLPLKGERKPRPFLQTRFNEYSPKFSPDGRWLAYVSDETGRDEVYVRAYPGAGGKQQISTEGGTEPVWARNGRELFYRNGDKMMEVTVTTRPTFTAGKPKLLFEKPSAMTHRPDAWQNYDITPDGQRFLMIQGSEQEARPTQIHVVLNWFEELKRRVPARKK